MLSESRRKKLEMLTRSLAAGQVKRAERILRRVGRKAPSAPPAREPLALAQAGPGTEAGNERGSYWLVRRPLADVSGDDLDVQRRYAGVLRGARQRFDELEASPALCHIADGRPEDPVFMDIETCGLAGAPIFMVGLMTYRRGRLIFEQLFARHYGEEPAILAAFAERLASAKTLVTFNGKSFDMTMLRDRSAFHGLDLPGQPPPLRPAARVPPPLAGRAAKLQAANTRTLSVQAPPRRRHPGSEHPRGLPPLRRYRRCDADQGHPAPQPAGPADHERASGGHSHRRASGRADVGPIGAGAWPSSGTNPNKSAFRPSAENTSML